MVAGTLLSICPTRNRPYVALRLYDSWKQTRQGEGSHIVFYVSEDDTDKRAYLHYLVSAGAEVVVGARKYLVDVINDFALGRDFKYYNNINDDHVYQTVGWDLKLIGEIEGRGGWGVACPRDLFSNIEDVKNPSGEVVSGNIVRTLGHYFHPMLLHLGADEYLRELTEELGLMYFAGDVVTEHCHPYREMGKLDDNYRWVYSPESDYHRQRVLEYWRKNLKATEQDKIRKAMVIK